MAQSDIRRMSRECERIGGINLGQGICDLPVPPLVTAAAKEAIDAGKNSYSYAEGSLELREAIAHKLARDNGLEVDPRSEVLVTVGALGAFTTVLMGLLDPGDGILLMEPYYGYHLNNAILVGLEPQFLTLQQPTFALTEQGLRDAIRPNTRAVVVCTPSNPSGKMFDAHELAILDRVAAEHDLLVITDEIYEYVRYDGRPHISPATIGNLRARTVSISGFSKTFSITGWRLGYAAAPASMIQSMTLVNDLFYICAPTPLQHAVARGLTAPRSYFENLADQYQKKRDMLARALDAAGLRPIVPQGAYYMLADVSSLGFASAREAAMALLESAKVAAVPGSAFFRGQDGERLLRFCFAKDDDVLAEACRRLEAFGCR
jgi:aminotransferase